MGVLFQKTKTGILSPINNTVDSLISASNGLMCLKNAVFGAIPNPSAIIQGMASIAAGMISAITGAVTEVINRRVGQIIKSVLSPIRQIEAIISDVTKILVSVQGIINKATNMDLYFRDKQDCTNMASQLMNCLATSAVNKLTNKIAMDVDKHIGKIADSVSKEAFSATGAIQSHVKRQTDFIAKAQLQTKLLT